MEKNNLTPEQSINVILNAIDQTRERAERNAHRPFLVWGYATIITTLAVWYAIDATLNAHYFFLWFALPVLGCIGMKISFRRESKGEAKTHIERVINHLWMILGIAGGIAALTSWIGGINILYVEALLMACGTAITGLVLRWRTVTLAGVASILLTPLFAVVEGIDRLPVFAALFVVMMVIPGHIIAYKLKRE